jgi:hypothetical protein
MLRLPDAMLRYMTWELEELLGQISAAQVTAIHRIIEAGHLVDEPLAPYSLVTGADPICARNTWVKRGKFDEETGEWRGAGWSHRKEFVTALQLAKKLARRVQVEESLGAVRQAVRRARLASPAVVDELVSIATGQQLVRQADGSWLKLERASADKDRIAASRVVLGVATADTAQDDGADDLAADWWAATQE